MSHYIAIHATTTNDTNGNPRRLFLIINTHREYLPIQMVIEEGYSGVGALDVLTKLLMKPAEVTKLKHFILNLEVTPGEYQELRRAAKRAKSYVP